jgi:hypothetical protein
MCKYILGVIEIFLDAIPRVGFLEVNYLHKDAKRIEKKLKNKSGPFFNVSIDLGSILDLDTWFIF